MEQQLLQHRLGPATAFKGKVGLVQLLKDPAQLLPLEIPGLTGHPFEKIGTDSQLLTDLVLGQPLFLKLTDLQSGEQFTIVSVTPDITPDELRAATTDNPPDPVFLDLEGHISDPVIAEAVQELKECCQFLKVLGSYPARTTKKGRVDRLPQDTP